MLAQWPRVETHSIMQLRWTQWQYSPAATGRPYSSRRQSIHCRSPTSGKYDHFSRPGKVNTGSSRAWRAARMISTQM